MKSVKIKFVGFWKGFSPENSIIYKIISKYYKPIICDDPDYIICSCFDEKYEYLKYPQIRIMVCGENYIPDFNFIDYAICRYPIDFLDRCFYEPGCLRPFPECFNLEKNIQLNLKDLQKKDNFCNFICSHESEHNIRGDFFKKLCEYKKVDSVGPYLNNCPEITVNRFDGTKRAFQQKSKFTLCFESTKSEGFFTEKLTDAFLSNTIPIYYGSSTVKTVFNKNAFIDISDFSSFEDAINKIIEIDQNDQLYLKMINENKLIDKNYISEKFEQECEFIKHIFDQSISGAYRRSRVYAPFDHEKYILNLKSNHKHHKFNIKKLIRK